MHFQNTSVLNASKKFAYLMNFMRWLQVYKNS